MQYQALYRLTSKTLVKNLIKAIKNLQSTPKSSEEKKPSFPIYQKTSFISFERSKKIWQGQIIVLNCPCFKFQWRTNRKSTMKISRKNDLNFKT